MLAKRLTAIGGLLLSFFMLSLGTDVDSGQEAYFFPNLITYFLIGFALILLIIEGDLLNWLKEIKNNLLGFFFSDSSQENSKSKTSQPASTSRYSSLYLSISQKLTSSEQESIIKLKKIKDDFFALIPMLFTIFCYLNFAETIGLYTTSFIAFVLITIIYTTNRPRNKTLLKNIFIALIFIGFIYLVFAVLLKLQTPSAWLL